jgi:hypothetical protein
MSDNFNFSRPHTLGWETLYDLREAIKQAGCDVTEDRHRRTLYAMAGPDTIARIDYAFDSCEGHLWLMDDDSSHADPRLSHYMQVRCVEDVQEVCLTLQEHMRQRLEQREANTRVRHLTDSLRDLLLVCATSQEEDWSRLVRREIPETCVRLLACLGHREASSANEPQPG